MPQFCGVSSRCFLSCHAGRHSGFYLTTRSRWIQWAGRQEFRGESRAFAKAFMPVSNGNRQFAVAMTCSETRVWIAVMQSSGEFRELDLCPWIPACTFHMREIEWLSIFHIVTSFRHLLREHCSQARRLW